MTANSIRIAVAGAGVVGRFVAKDLVSRGHDVVVIEQNKELIEALSDEYGFNWVAVLSSCEFAIAATGDDEDNLVISLLAKQEFAVPRVVARVNHPDNEWMFTESWGVDLSVSTPHLLTSLVEEAVSVGDLVRLLKFEQGKIALFESRLADGSPANGKTVQDLRIPPDCTLVAVVRDRHVITPRAETSLEAGDEVLAVAALEAERDLRVALTGDE
jgi:trk system potassium uptake protein TrkA